MLNTFLFLVLLLFSFVANANFMIYPISKDVHEGGSDIIRVYSKSAETQYIKIYTKKIINPGSQNEQEVDSSNWKEGLVVSPVKLILPAGSSKSVRLTQIKKIDYEEVYRIYFESVSPQKKEHEGNIKKLNTELSVNIIYAALIRVLPENKKMSANASINTNGNIIVNNTGNVRIGIKNIYFCKGEEINNECTAKEYNKSIYPGNTLDTMIANKRYRHIFLKINNSESTQKQGENIHLRIP